jgi:hypothetical protein
MTKLRVPGSSPGRAFAGTVAQLVEQQMFLRSLSPQVPLPTHSL